MYDLNQGFWYDGRLASAAVFWHQTLEMVDKRERGAMPAMSEDSELSEWSEIGVVKSLYCIAPEGHDVALCELGGAISAWWFLC